jgi:beta-phosphoglucomutase
MRHLDLCNGIIYSGPRTSYWNNRYPASFLRSIAAELELIMTEYDLHGFIFDLDGVLTDTSEYHYRGWQRFCDDESIPFDRQANEALRGVHRSDAMRMLLSGRTVSDEQFNEMLQRKNRYYLEYMQELSPANMLPGALELLREVRDAGMKIAIGSASKNAPRVIDKLGIRPLIDAISDGNSVNRSKPAPDLFLHAADQIGLEPAVCVVVEDAEAGVAAGRSGGMRVIGLGPTGRVGEADLVLPDLASAKLDDILSVLLPIRPPAPPNH